VVNVYSDPLMPLKGCCVEDSTAPASIATVYVTPVVSSASETLTVNVWLSIVIRETSVIVMAIGTPTLGVRVILPEEA